MKSKHLVTLAPFVLAVFSAATTARAEALSAEQEKIIQQYLSSMPAEQVELVRSDPSARLEFLRSIAASMTLEERAAFRNCWKSMTHAERQQALLKF